MEDILTNEQHSTRNRTPLISKLSSTVEKHTVFNPKPDKVRGINASGSKPLVFYAELQSAKGRNSESVGSFFFFSNPELIRDRIFAFNRLLEKGLKHLLLCFPFPRTFETRGTRWFFVTIFESSKTRCDTEQEKP